MIAHTIHMKLHL